MIFKNNYSKLHKKVRPKLALMKIMYDEAISDNPDLRLIVGFDENKEYTEEELNTLRTQANREAVEALKKISLS